LLNNFVNLMHMRQVIRPALLLKMWKVTLFKPLKTNKYVTNVFHPNVC